MSIHAQGLRTWLWQRLTSIYIALFLLVAVIWFLLTDDLGYGEWRAVMADPVVNIATALFVPALLFHVGIGIRDILIDYVHPLGLRFFVMVVMVVILLALGIWSMMILMSVVAL